MAFTVTNIAGSVADSTGFVTALSTGSFTPTANGVMFYWCQTSLEADLSTISGHGGTWTKIAHVDSITFSYRLHLYYLATGASPSADTVDITLTSSTVFHGVMEVTGDIDDTDPVVQSATDVDYISSAGTLTPTLTGFTTDNLCLVFSGSQINGTVISVATSFTQLFSVEETESPDTEAACHYKENDGSPVVSHDAGIRDLWAIAVEVAAAAAVTNPVFTTGHAQRNVRHSGRY